MRSRTRERGRTRLLRDPALAGALGLSATFGMTMGDILSDDLCLYPHHNRMIGQGDIPWRHIGGQYDLSVVAPDAEPGEVVQAFG